MKENAKVKKLSAIEVPIPAEIGEIAHERGVSEEKLIRSLQRLLILEAVAMNSKMEMDEALKLGKQVGRGLWTKLQ
ncbi:hypothetical protein K1720_06035 [Thermococcus argininiproducens]|uniref:Uncharacterized protein n=1 Tax=Thermococcus argininiproducens TaxID=2866384 RepID=A0A9E7M9B9_9EURY|nr:hypothetical protein [Thermococcus argininiproducens]USG99106.1 hypothetical protein K1720_06035 [Thermococcus argininiproducens]